MKKRMFAFIMVMFILCSMFLCATAQSGDTYTIPESVTVITHNDVVGLEHITKLIIHENVVKIGYNVFCMMPNLEEVYMYTRHDLDATWDFGVNDITAGYDFTVYGYENVRRWVEHMNNPYLDNSAGLGKYMPKSNFINFVLLEETQGNQELNHTNIQPVSPTSQQGDIKVVVNGRYVDFDVPPQIINNRTMVPVRAIFEALGATVEWFGEERKVLAEKWYEPTQGWVFAEFVIGRNYMRNSFGEMIDELDTPPMIIDNRTLVPARAAAEAFNYQVEWDGDSRTVYIYE